MSTAMQKKIAEHPILFSSPMVRAILENRKSQTRRVVKIKDKSDLSSIELRDDGEWYARLAAYKGVVFSVGTCPYGEVGDRLWVRETWQTHSEDGALVRCLYKADDEDLSDWISNDTGEAGIKWKPSIFMPRRFSRITLEITEVRAERLQDISREDALAEGIETRYHPDDPDLLTYKDYSWHTERFAYGTMFGPRESFLGAWDLINAKRGYPAKDNPFVFAISFRRIK